MKNPLVALLLFLLALMLGAAIFLFAQFDDAEADWRWAKPHFKTQYVAIWCDTPQCIHMAHKKAKQQRQRKIHRYNVRKRAEWRYWTRLYIPTCTWYGESGVGPQFAVYRYYLPNSTGSGAFGKYQMMSGTYHSRAEYHDWTPLDQEIAGHREFWAHGTYPWANCH